MDHFHYFLFIWILSAYKYRFMIFYILYLEIIWSILTVSLCLLVLFVEMLQKLSSWTIQLKWHPFFSFTMNQYNPHCNLITARKLQNDCSAAEVFFPPNQFLVVRDTINCNPRLPQCASCGWADVTLLQVAGFSFFIFIFIILYQAVSYWFILEARRMQFDKVICIIQKYPLASL